MEAQIPKIIHYCWFGPKKMPKLVNKCIKSWKKYFPGYEFILWNESNFDVSQNLYVKQAYDAKKYAFVTDYVRLYALYNYGGIYMDTDVEILKSMDSFLTHSAFTGSENEKWVQTAVMGAKKNHPWIERLLKYYNDATFINEDGSYNMRTNVNIITEITRNEYNWKAEKHIQVIKDDLYIYPAEYFCPYNWQTKKMNLSKNSYSIHHFNGSWLNKQPLMSRLKSSVFIKSKKILSIIVGKRNIEILKRKFL